MTWWSERLWFRDIARKRVLPPSAVAHTRLLLMSSTVRSLAHAERGCLWRIRTLWHVMESVSHQKCRGRFRKELTWDTLIKLKQEFRYNGQEMLSPVRSEQLHQVNWWVLILCSIVPRSLEVWAVVPWLLPTTDFQSWSCKWNAPLPPRSQRFWGTSPTPTSEV